MSGRCSACNAVMSDEDMCRKFPPDEEGKRQFSDLCGECHQVAMEVLFDTYHEPDYLNWIFADEFTLRNAYIMSEVQE